MNTLWVSISITAFITASLYLIVAGVVTGLLLGRLAPLLDETRQRTQDLGDLATETVAHAADTMQLIEARVEEGMLGAVQAGSLVKRQAVGIGTLVAGLYAISRFAGALRVPRRRGRSRRR